MAIQVKSAIAHATHEMGKGFPVEMDPLHIVNMAGSALVNMRSWGWLVRPTAALNLVANDPTVQLPEDFGSIRTLYSTDETTSHARWVSMDELAWRRSAQTQYTDNLISYVALSFARGGDRYEAQPSARLEVFSTPTVSTAGVFRLLYVAGWVEVTSDDDELPIHPSCDLLYLETLRAITMGLMKSHEGSISARLSEIASGSPYRDAAAADIRREGNTPVFIPHNAHAIWPVPKLVT